MDETSAAEEPCYEVTKVASRELYFRGSQGFCVLSWEK